jgi:hydroxymethylglutaryl-CoA lyase
MTEHVTIFEMGPRDGLQNEKKQIATTDKVALVDQLSDCGFSNIEVTSFVSPKWVPQMGDAREVMAAIQRKGCISYAALTPNLKGFEAALEAKADEVAIFAAASQGFSQKNINCSIEESIERFKPVMQAANENGVPVRGYVSCVTDCPYDGAIPAENVARVADQLMALGCYEISLGDTIGAAEPDTIETMLNAVLTYIPAKKLAGHYHDTRGQALANIKVSLDAGLRVFDASIGGLGGCPYAPGAKGNVATEEVVEMLHGLGFETGVDLKKIQKIAEFAKTLRSAA